MDNIVVGEQAWLQIYTSPDDRASETWIICKLSNGTEIFSCITGKIDNIKKYCNKHNASIDSVGLRFRSNTIKQNTKDCDAVYIVKSVRGQMGGNTIYCLVLGTLKNGIVSKTAYCTPELLEIYTSEDKVEDCFEEMLIYNDKKANKQK